MGGKWIPRQPGRISLISAPRAFCWVAGGLVLDGATVIVGALNAVSVQQAIAMGLPAALTTAAGMIGLLIPDPLTAWRRGFQHGCAAAAKYESCQGAARASSQSARQVLSSALFGTHAPGRHTLSARRSGSRRTAAYVLRGRLWEPVGVHVLDSEQRENLRDRRTGRVGDAPDGGHGCGLARQAFGSKKGMNHLVAVAPLPHPDEHPASQALT